MEALDFADNRYGDEAAPEIESLARTSQAAAGIVSLIRDDSGRVVANWVIHVANTPAFRAWPHLSLAELQRSVPDLIEAILAAIRFGQGDRTSDAIARTVDVAAEHGCGRGRSGFPIGALLAEFKALREELCAALNRATGDDPGWYDAAREVEMRLNTTLDLVLIEAAEGWVAGAHPQTDDA